MIIRVKEPKYLEFNLKTAVMLFIGPHFLLVDLYQITFALYMM